MIAILLHIATLVVCLAIMITIVQGARLWNRIIGLLHSEIAGLQKQVDELRGRS